MSNTYLWLKVIHILGVMLFMGNIIITGWWKNMADATKNPQIIAFAQRQVTLTDYIFTFGGILILAITGFTNVYLHEISYSIPWLKNGVIYFLLSGLIWLFILIPVQAKQAKMSRTFAQNNEIPATYWQLCTILAAMHYLEHIWFVGNFFATSNRIFYGDEANINHAT